MKELEYNGSITDDFNSAQERKYNIFTHLKKEPSAGLEFLLIIKQIFISKAISKLNLGAITACYITTFIHMFKRFKKSKNDFLQRRMDIEDNINELGEISLNEKRMYKVLSQSKTFEKKVTEELVNKYIDHISSDIYYIDNEDKIAVLRELKTFYRYKKSKTTATHTKLFKLDDDELPPRNQMPVRQVLKLKNETK